MKWFYLVSFVAALFCSIFWTGVIIFAIATHRLAAMELTGVAFLAPLPFFIWGALEMFRSYGTPDVISEIAPFRSVVVEKSTLHSLILRIDAVRAGEDALQG